MIIQRSKTQTTKAACKQNVLAFSHMFQSGRKFCDLITMTACLFAFVCNKTPYIYIYLYKENACSDMQTKYIRLFPHVSKGKKLF